MTKIWDSIVIGAGQAGLASGYHLQKKGLRFLILEANDQVTGAWSQYYDSLKLFSPSRFSSLPGMKFPGVPDHYPVRNEIIRYLQDYTEHFQLPVMTNLQVVSIEKNARSSQRTFDEVFTVRTKNGDTFHSRTIINATGSFQSPYKPEIKEQEAFQGRIIHSAEYRNPDHFIDQRVVIVGRRNSAVQIAVELAKVNTTTLAVRRPVQLVQQRFLGQDLHFWVTVTGFDTFPFWRFGKNVPSPDSVIDQDRYKERLAAGKPDQKPMFISFYTDGVIWSDGTKEPVDTVIFATGYRPNLAYLRDTEALDSEGKPLQIAGVSTSVPGLYYVGLEGQRSFASATLRGVGPDARFVVRRLLHHLQG